MTFELYVVKNLINNLYNFNYLLLYVNKKNSFICHVFFFFFWNCNWYLIWFQQIQFDPSRIMLNVVGVKGTELTSNLRLPNKYISHPHPNQDKILNTPLKRTQTEKKRTPLRIQQVDRSRSERKIFNGFRGGQRAIVWSYASNLDKGNNLFAI